MSLSESKKRKHKSDDADAPKPKRPRIEHDPSIDPITADTWKNPRLLVSCGHIYGGDYVNSFRNAQGGYVCTVCKTISAFTAPVHTDCVRPDTEQERSPDTDATSTLSFTELFDDARVRRQHIYERCMGSLRKLLMRDIAKHHWCSTLHPLLDADTNLVYTFRSLADTGIFNSPDEFLVCITYKNGAYRDFFSSENLSIVMKLVEKQDIAEFRASPDKCKIGIKYTCVDGFDGDLDASPATTRLRPRTDSVSLPSSPSLFLSSDDDDDDDDEEEEDEDSESDSFNLRDNMTTVTTTIRTRLRRPGEAQDRK